MSRGIQLKKLRCDTSKNGEKTDLLIEAQRIREKKLKRLRIDDKITILVPESKCNEEYRLWYIDNVLNKPRLINGTLCYI